MSAPIIWIAIPIFVSIILLFLKNRNLITFIGTGISILLAIVAGILTIDSPVTLGTWNINISSSLTFFGRQLILSPLKQPLLIYIFTAFAIWCIFFSISHHPIRSISYGFMILGLLISSIAVDPFLYAAVFIEIAVLISIPFLKPSGGPAGKGLLRYLVFQTIAMPFILFSGWLLTGISSSPEGFSLVSQASVFLGFGFIFLLAIFPFNTWIPLLSEETHPVAFAFILWIFTTIAFLFGFSFINNFAWIRESDSLYTILKYIGIIMIISSSVLSAFQMNLKRIFAYAIMFETGISLLALGTGGTIGILLFFKLLLPHTLILILWAFALLIISTKLDSMNYSTCRGIAGEYPFASAVIVFSQLSLVGFPIIAGFSERYEIWLRLGKDSISSAAIWFIFSILCMFFSGIRTLTVFTHSENGGQLLIKEKGYQRIIFFLGLFLMIFMGLFPQWVHQLAIKMPLMFNHISQ